MSLILVTAVCLKTLCPHFGPFEERTQTNVAVQSHGSESLRPGRSTLFANDQQLTIDNAAPTGTLESSTPADQEVLFLLRKILECQRLKELNRRRSRDCLRGRNPYKFEHKQHEGLHKQYDELKRQVNGEMEQDLENQRRLRESAEEELNGSIAHKMDLLEQLSLSEDHNTELKKQLAASEALVQELLNGQLGQCV